MCVCVSPVMDGRLVQGVPHLAPEISRDRLQLPPRPGVDRIAGDRFVVVSTFLELWLNLNVASFYFNGNKSDVFKLHFSLCVCVKLQMSPVHVTVNQLNRTNQMLLLCFQLLAAACCQKLTAPVISLNPLEETL